MSLRRLVVLFVSCLLFSACGDDGGNANNIVDVPDSSMNNVNNVDDMGDMDDNDMDMGDMANTNNNGGPSCVGVMCEAGLKCVRGDCVAMDAKLACDEVKDEGILPVTQAHTFVGDTTNFVDTFDTACVQTVNNYSGPENVFRFQVNARALTRLTLTSSATNVDWLMEVRTGDCGAAGESLVCSDPETTQFVAQPGVDYFLVVEPAIGFDTGPFQVAAQFQEQNCTVGDRTCMGADIEVCGSGTFACANGCNAGDCFGNTCAVAIDVNGAMSFSGDTQGYTSQFNFENEMSCSPSMMGGIATPGPDMVLRLPGLTVGQTITVDTTMNDDNDNAIFVLTSCQAPSTTCAAGRDLGDVLNYTVETAGDHFVVIDKLTASPKPFNYMIDVQ